MHSNTQPHCVVFKTTLSGLSSITLCDVVRTMKEIRENLKRIRKSKGLSQAQLAELCGFDGGKKAGQTRISNYEVGEREIGTTELIKFGKALGVGLEELLPTGTINVSKGPRFKYAELQEGKPSYEPHELSVQAKSLINLITSLDINKKLTKELAGSISTLLSAYK
jgi:transcriptional regulator with XRE-family HTH domain